MQKRNITKTKSFSSDITLRKDKLKIDNSAEISEIFNSFFVNAPAEIVSKIDKNTLNRRDFFKVYKEL